MSDQQPLELTEGEAKILYCMIKLYAEQGVFTAAQVAKYSGQSDEAVQAFIDRLNEAGQLLSAPLEMGGTTGQITAYGLYNVPLLTVYMLNPRVRE